MLLTNNYIKMALAFGMYALSVLSLLLLDIYISKIYNQNFVTEWAFLKSFLLIVVSTVSLGYESVIVRDPDNLKFYLKKYIIPCILYSLILSCIFNILKDSNWSLAIIFFSIAMGFNVILSSFYKTKNNIFLSQFLMNGWKLIFPIIFLFFSGINLVFTALISAILCVLFALPMVSKAIDKKRVETKQIFERKTLFYLFLNSLTLAVATNGEQIILNTFAETKIAYDVFVYILIFCSIISGLSGFLGFYLVYHLKKIKFNTLIYKKYLSYGFLALVFLFIINLFFGYILMILLYGSVNLYLAILFSLLGVIRFAYVFSSVMMSLYSNEKNIIKISITNSFLIFIYIITFISACFLDLENITYIIVLIMITHWILRLLFMNQYTMRSFRE